MIGNSRAVLVTVYDVKRRKGPESILINERGTNGEELSRERATVSKLEAATNPALQETVGASHARAAHPPQCVEVVAAEEIGLELCPTMLDASFDGTT